METIRTASVNGTDQHLLSRVARGDGAALARIYGDHKNDLLSAAAHLLGDPAAAEDVLQDVFVALARRAGSIRLTGRLRSYLLAACLNRARDLLRRRGREPIPVETLGERRSAEAGPAERAAAKDEATRVAAALTALPVAQREVLVLKVYGQLTFREIAEMTALSINTVMSRHRYALEALRRRLLSEGARR